MPVDFKYIPEAPEPLSGPAFIEQTMRAFNELGGNIDDNTATANEALATANNAAQVSQEALETAQDTVSTANTALTTANTALSNSTDALNKANTAYDNAANAVSVSNVAKATADAAKEAADAAVVTAGDAVSNIAVAISTADTALSAAQNAVAIASSANDEYSVNASVVNANEQYADPERSYLTNTANTNFPIAMSCFFNVITTSDGLSVTQQCWNDETTLYRRYATIDNTDPENPVITWSEWVALGVGGGGGGGSSGSYNIPNKRIAHTNSSLSWAPPIDTTYKVTLIGGGGGGGGGGGYTATNTALDYLAAGGGGGGSGEAVTFYIDLKTTDQIRLYIGAGGDSTAMNGAGYGAVAGKGGGSTRMIVGDSPSSQVTYWAGGGGGGYASVVDTAKGYTYSGGNGGIGGYNNRRRFIVDQNSPMITYYVEDAQSSNGFAGMPGTSVGGSYVAYLRPNGGNGGSNGTGYGGGGGGGGGKVNFASGTVLAYGMPGRGGDLGDITLEPEFDPMGTVEYLYYGSTAGVSGNSGRGGDGIVIIEYYDPNA